jgi:diadenosine tetraphosphatase ApaH/serine/threonine PP2A family protein phosphatase
MIFARLARRGADLTVNLGDICSGPLFPCETADRLMALGLPTICGNHERQLLTLPHDRMGLSDLYAIERLNVKQREWLETLPETHWLTDGVLMVHGMPASDLQYFLHTVEPAGLREASIAEIYERAGEIDAEVILCGHTHLPASIALPDGRLIVNPGSVGLQAYVDDHPYRHDVETGTPHARYARLKRLSGRWSVEAIQVAYDWNSAAKQAQLQGREDWAIALRSGTILSDDD